MEHIVPKWPKMKGIYKVYFLVLTILNLIAIYPFVYLVRYTNPQGEDFSIALDALVNGHVLSVKWLYETFDGRYFSNFIYAINPLVYKNFDAYRGFALGLFILLFIAVFLLVKRIFKQGKKSDNLIVVLALTTFYIALFVGHLAQPLHSFYYMASSVVYLLPALLYSFYILVILSMSKSFSYSYKNILQFLVAILLNVAVIGGVELMMPIMLITNVLLLTYSVKKSALPPHIPLLLLFASILACLIVSIAPGLYASFDAVPVQRSSIDQLKFGITAASYNSIKLLKFWYFDHPSMFFGTILLLITFYMFRNQVRIVKLNLSVQIIFAMMFLGLILLFAFPFYWSVGIDKFEFPHRVYNLFLYLFLCFGTIVALFFISSKWLAKLGRKFIVTTPVKTITLIMLTLFFYYFLFTTNNIQNAYADIKSGKAKAYSEELNRRFDDMFSGGTADTVVFNIIEGENCAITLHGGHLLDPTKEEPLWDGVIEEYFEIGHVKFDMN